MCLVLFLYFYFLIKKTSFFNSYFFAVYNTRFFGKLLFFFYFSNFLFEFVGRIEQNKSVNHEFVSSSGQLFISNHSNIFNFECAFGTLRLWNIFESHCKSIFKIYNTSRCVFLTRRKTNLKYLKLHIFLLIRGRYFS